ncbi:hypothetical protein BH10ACI1_BH10ACI1_19930 [soil metagenome]
MLSNNKNSSCAFSGHIVSYLYDEATSQEKNDFETHLPDCLNCSDEIAGFGLVRSSINEWRNDEFFKLESDSLKISALRSTKPVETAINTDQSDSWINKVRRLFTFSPVFVGGFAALVICLGLGWLFIENSQKNIVADVNKTLEIPSVSPLTLNNVIMKPDESIVKKDSQAVQNKQIIEVGQNNLENQKLANSTSNRSKKSLGSKAESPKKVETIAENNVNKKQKSTKVPNSTKPTLSGMTEDEDNSLRLSELFAEIDTK